MTISYSVHAETRTSPWLVISNPVPNPRLRLFCFPYAGAGPVVFRNWQDELPAGIELAAVHLPGRESRIREAPVERIEALLDALSEAVQPKLDLPFALYGHSLGGLIAFELARRLRSQHAALPLHLLISSRRAPHLPDPYPPIHQLPNLAFANMIQQRYKGIPDVILQDAELLEVFLPTLRADFTVFETYQYTPEPPLPMPISVFLGEQDATIAAEDGAAWREHTSAAFAMRSLPGDHFFLQTQREALLRLMSAELSRYLAP